MKVKAVFQFLLCVAFPLVAGGLSGFFTAGAVTDDWYVTLIKPSFNPPNYIFGPVWTTLYFLMGVSLFMIVRSEKGMLRTNAILIFCMQLFLNFWWSIFFFYFERPDVSLGEIALLWLTIIWMIVAFKKVKPAAAYMQIPYLLWVSFASFLNATLWWLNR